MKKLTPPKIILFDWHGTLVNTLDAMYLAIEDMFMRLEELGLVNRLIPEEQAKTKEDAKLLRYIRIYRRLHPRILAERRVSRTDIFNALFGSDSDAIEIAHKAYNESYRRYFGAVYAFQEGIYDYLTCLKQHGMQLGIVTNRSREFLQEELRLVDEGRWNTIFDTTVCGNEVAHYKPAPDVLVRALNNLKVPAGNDVWYVGDSITDMITARKAGTTSIFYNGGLWEDDWIEHMFSAEDRPVYQPDAIVNDFDQLLDVICESDEALGAALNKTRPPRLPPRQPPPPHIEPDWHPAVANLSVPKIILFDWHATLVDTLEAMYHAVDDILLELADLDLVQHLVGADSCRSPDDMKLVEFVRNYQRLHPKIKADRKISRTDIFEILFGDNETAKRIAHREFNKHYRKYYGEVLPFEPQVKSLLQALRALEFKVGVITNRDREFFAHELDVVEGTGWADLFDTQVCGDDVEQRKPHPDQILKAVANLSGEVTPQVWYVGDSTTDTIAAKMAGVTAVFFNGAQWDETWLNTIFPGNERYPYKPDVVVNDFSEFWALVLACRDKALALQNR